MITLRGYQNKLIQEARESLRDQVVSGASQPSTLVVLPTGGGKTVIFANISAGIQQNKKFALILVHRVELLDQTSKTLRACGVPHGIIASGVPETAAWVQIGMVATVAKRLDRMQQFDLLITDECHHTPAKTYVDILDHYPSARRLGFTATPERLDGKGLGNFYNDMVQGPTITELIIDGWLVPPDVYAPKIAADLSKLHTKYGDFVKSEMVDALDKASITGDVVEHYKKICPDTAAVAFCISIEHAQHVAQTFSSAGVPAMSIDGKLSKEERKARLAALRDGRIKVLTSCDLISEGFDLPRLETAILLRPTQSLSLFLQQVGRALRPDPERGKKCAYILDHVGNCARFGLPDDDRSWSLGGKASRPKEEAEIILKTCRECFAYYRGDRCRKCGLDAPPTPREIEVVDGELVKVEGNGRKYVDLTREEWLALRNAGNTENFFKVVSELNLDPMWAKKVVSQRANSLGELRKVEKMLGYKAGWAKHRYVARHGLDGYEEALVVEMMAAGGME